MDFIHPLLNDQIMAIGGYYVITKEEKLSFKDREVLYLVGYGLLDNSCCGSGGCGYAIVPGYVVAWRAGKTLDQKQHISSVEPVEEECYNDIVKILRDKECISQVQFLTPACERKVISC